MGEVRGKEKEVRHTSKQLCVSITALSRFSFTSDVLMRSETKKPFVLSTVALLGKLLTSDQQSGGTNFYPKCILKNSEDGKNYQFPRLISSHGAKISQKHRPCHITLSYFIDIFFLIGQLDEISKSLTLLGRTIGSLPVPTHDVLI